MRKDVKEYLDEARTKIDKKDVVGFTENISIAKYLVRDDEELLTEVLLEQSEGFYKLAEYKKAMEVIEELLNQETIKDTEIKLELLRKKGIILGKRGKYEEAIQIFEQLVDEEFLKFKIVGLGNLAGMYMLMYIKNKEKSYISKAQEHCKEALILFDNFVDNKLYKQININLGTSYWHNEEYEEALEVFLKTYEIDENDPTILNNIATTYVNLKEGEFAEEYLEKAETLAMKQENSYAIANSNLIRGRLAYMVYDDTFKAKDYFLVAFDQFGKINGYIEMCDCLDNMLELDAKINRESITILSKRLKDGLSKSFEQWN